MKRLRRVSDRPFVIPSHNGAVLLSDMIDGHLSISFFRDPQLHYGHVAQRHVRHLVFTSEDAAEATLPLLDSWMRLLVEWELDNHAAGFSLLLPRDLQELFEPLKQSPTLDHWRQWTGLSTEELLNITYPATSSPADAHHYIPEPPSDVMQLALVYGGLCMRAKAEQVASQEGLCERARRQDKVTKIGEGGHLTGHLPPDGRYRVRMLIPGHRMTMCHSVLEGTMLGQPHQLECLPVWYFEQSRDAEGETFQPRHRYHRTPPLDLLAPTI